MARMYYARMARMQEWLMRAPPPSRMVCSDYEPLLHACRVAEPLLHTDMYVRMSHTACMQIVNVSMHTI